MLLLYGTGDFFLQSQAIDDESTENILFNACQLLAARGKLQAVGLLSAFDFAFVTAEDEDHQFKILYAEVSLPQYEYLKQSTPNDDIKNAFMKIAVVLEELNLNISCIACELRMSSTPENWRANLTDTISALSSNQALFNFKNSDKIIHKGLNFRSKTEIRIYDALVRRQLLFFPLPVAVLGAEHKYKEPDFVVCYNGRVGILEIHGDKWHTPMTAAQEHDRRREFAKLGITIFEVFDAGKCWHNPDEVVNVFLQSFLH